MSLSSTERKLLKRLAEAYAFIGDLRETGLRIGNSLIVQRTQGIEKSVAQLKSEFPRIFQRFYNNSLKRADAERRTITEKDNKYGQGKNISGREKEKEKLKSKRTTRSDPRKEKRSIRRGKPE